MKRKTVIARRQKSSNRSNKGQKSAYAHKIQLQKKGVYNDSSPFNYSGQSAKVLSIAETNNIRFKR